MDLDYEVVDVFTDTAFTGNPLAVVLGADDLSTSQLQRIAREFNLSETAFPVAADVDGADYRLRIFTPAVELPFAGHPSVGTAEVLRRRGVLRGDRAVQSCGAGLVPLAFDDGDRVRLSARVHFVGEPLDPAPVLAACGLDAADLAGVPRTASCGLAFTYLPVQPDALARVRPDVATLQRLGLGGGRPFGGLSVVAVDGPVDGALDGAVLRCRVFAYEAGVAEDPATGSAALGLGAWLHANGHLPHGGAYDVVQGVEMGRPSRLSCAVVCDRGQVDHVSVAGQVVPVAQGRIRVP